MRFIATVMVLGLLVSLAGCSKPPPVVRPDRYPSKRLVVLPRADDALPSYEINGQRYHPLPEEEGFVQFGKASWYGRKFHGRPTSSGEVYDMYQKTAAHKTLPLNTYVLVSNLSNSRETVVRINDRGPFVEGRVIDLSYGAAKAIDSVGPGVVDVKITALGREVDRVRTPLGIRPVVETRDLKRGGFTVQVGAFTKNENALRVADRLRVIFRFVDVTVSRDARLGTVYRVRVSRSDTLEEAGKVERRLESMGFKTAFVVSL